MGATEIAALTQEETEREYFPETAYEKRAQPFIGPRPRIVTRRGWGANENLRERGFVYTKKVKAAFVHHTASGNKYSCSQVPSLIRGIYRYHVVSSGWRDIGYNFLVDKCGNIYEGRAGGVAKAVKGAHTLGFNTNSMGIAVLGNFAGDEAARRRAQGHRAAHGMEARSLRRQSAWQDIPDVGRWQSLPKGKERTTERDLRPSGRVRHGVPRTAPLRQARLGQEDGGPLPGPVGRTRNRPGRHGSAGPEPAEIT